MIRPRATSIALASLALLSACRSSPTSAPSPQSAAPPGLAAEVWIIRDTDHALARALLDLAAENPPDEVHPVAAERWRASGLRILTIPVRDLPTLRSALPPGGPAELRTFGQIPSWTPLFQGPELPDPTIRLDSGILRLPTGRPRILVRSWIEPAMDGLNPASGTIRIEIVPQHMDPLPPRDPIGVSQPEHISPVAQGQVFDRLLLTFVGEAGRAYLIVGEAPDVDWADLAPEQQAPQPEPAQDEPGDSGGGTDAAPSDPPNDPSPSDDRVPFPPAAASIIPTLGEAMLNGSSYARGSSPLRAVLAIIPSGAPAFSLLTP